MPSFPTYQRLAPESGPLAASDKLVIMHFGKTAGTSALSAILAAYPERRLCPDRGCAVEMWPISRLGEYDLFCCHATLGELSTIPGARKTITFLRNPIERALSEIEYHRSYRHDHVERYNLILPRLFRALSTKDVYSSNLRVVLELVINPYAYGLAGHRYFSPSGRPWRTDEEVLDHALENMKNMSFVGISEDLERSLELLSERLDMPQLNTAARDNVTSDNWVRHPDVFEEPRLAEEDASSEALEMISQAVALDTIIYDAAVQQFFKGEPLRRRHSIMCGDGGRTWRTGGGVWLEAKPAGGWVGIGPYCRMLPGSYEVEFSLRRSSGLSEMAPITLDVAHGRGAHIISSVEVRAAEVSQGDSTVRLAFTLPKLINDLEFRAFSPGASDILVANEVSVRLA